MLRRYAISQLSILPILPIMPKNPQLLQESTSLWLMAYKNILHKANYESKGRDLRPACLLTNKYLQDPLPCYHSTSIRMNHDDISSAFQLLEKDPVRWSWRGDETWFFPVHFRSYLGRRKGHSSHLRSTPFPEGTYHTESLQPHWLCPPISSPLIVSYN